MCGAWRVGTRQDPLYRFPTVKGVLCARWCGLVG